jgi:hypothetical protein
MNVRRMLYYGLIYLVLAYGIVVLGQSTKELTRQIFTLQKACKINGEVKRIEIM